MGHYLKYYDDERSRHYHLKNCALTEGQIFELSNKVFLAKNVPQIPVLIRDDANGAASLFRPEHKAYTKYAKNGLPVFHEARGNTIMILKSMFNTLTVIHELAHYLHWMEIKDTIKEHRKAGGKIRWHGARHKELVNDLALLAISWNFGKAPTVMDLPPVTAAQWWEHQDPVQHCSKCNKDYPKDDFGMAAKKNKDGTKTFTRQGYCKHCRKAYYAIRKAQGL